MTCVSMMIPHQQQQQQQQQQQNLSFGSLSSNVWSSDDDEERSTVVSSLPSRKRVRFDTRPALELEAIHTDLLDDDDVKSQVWYSAGELKAFKTSTIHLAKAIVQQDRSTMADARSYQRVVRRVWAMAQESNLDDQQQGVLELSTPERMRLGTCVSLSPTRLGLERLTIRGMRGDVAQRRAALYAHVRTVQAVDQQSSSSPVNKELALRYFSQKVSHSSTQFSRLLAEALCSNSSSDTMTQTKA